MSVMGFKKKFGWVEDELYPILFWIFNFDAKKTSTGDMDTQ